MSDDEDNKTENETENPPALSDEERIKRLSMIVCICKGIPLKNMIKAIKSSSTVQEVNKKTGSGSGGCKGERCGPRIKMLLKKAKEERE
ncbi:MAG: (2Fe-2S)-binding protein [Oligoflexales bacterium]|nr:(2Fe-2S)-binding protein [Oligoflexales bacterium]